MPARLQAEDNNRTVQLDKPILFVGRHPDCDIVINNSRKVSRKHCCLVEINGAFVVRDLGSTNGVHINRKRITDTQPLQNGDHLMIGDCPFIFQNDVPVPAKQVAHANPELSDSGSSNTGPNPDELSSEIPILLDEPEEEFDSYPPRRIPGKRRIDSDSHMELALD